MAKVAKHLTDLIGNTPLLELTNYNSSLRLAARIVAKLEYFNPLGSVKDRTAFALIADAEKRGLLKHGSIIIEPTGGNTGMALAFIAAVKGYKIILTMPETICEERQNLLKALGANLVLTPGTEGMRGAIQKAEELRNSISGSIILQQFDNVANQTIHFYTTAEEIWRDLDGRIDIFVAGVGTGGTISGVGEKLKEYTPQIQIIAVEPKESAVLSGGRPGFHKIQGIGSGFIPKNFNPAVVDQIVSVNSDDAIRTSRELARIEGLIVGISSGAAVFAATELAKLPANAGKTIVAFLPDTGERYLSTALYAFEDYPL